MVFRLWMWILASAVGLGVVVFLVSRSLRGWRRRRQGKANAERILRQEEVCRTCGRRVDPAVDLYFEEQRVWIHKGCFDDGLGAQDV